MKSLEQSTIILKGINQILLCTIYRINLAQYHRINMRREIYVAYGYEKNKKNMCVAIRVATGF